MKVDLRRQFYFEYHCLIIEKWSNRLEINYGNFYFEDEITVRIWPINHFSGGNDPTFWNVWGTHHQNERFSYDFLSFCSFNM